MLSILVNCTCFARHLNIYIYIYKAWKNTFEYVFPFSRIVLDKIQPGSYLSRIVDLHIHVYEKIVYIGIYKASEDATTLAFFSRLEALDAFAEKHLDLATKAASP